MRQRASILALLILAALPAHAVEFIVTNEYVIAADQSVPAEQWISAGTITAGGSFANDLFLASESDLALSGTFAGNVWGLAGTQAQFQGNCLRNLRLAGPTIRINGPVHGNLMALANTISIGTNAVISGDAQLFGNQIIVEGSIEGRLSLTATRTATLSATVGGNAELTAPEIILSDDARIQGNLSYTSSGELVPADEVVGGTLIRREAANAQSSFTVARLRNHALWFLAALLTGIPFISLFPMTSAMASLLARKSPFKCLLAGLAAFIALPMFVLITLPTIIGLPLGILLFASWGILAYCSRIIVALVIGTLVLKSDTTSAGRVLLSMAAGLAIIYILTFFPTSIGLMIHLLVIWIGMGALLLALLQKRRLIIQIPEELKQLEALKKEHNKSTEESQ